MQLLWKVIRNSLIGFGMAAISMLVFLLFSMHYQLETLSTEYMLRQQIGSMVFGAFCGLTALIYELKMFIRLLQLMIHFILLFTGYMVTGTILGWFTLSTMILPLFIFIFIYFCIWLSFYAYHKKLAKDLNELTK
ncbi:DUF3021 domain-containing protein [Terrilactibacillus laevilacticus]|uniref:DUF3021 domain-containing protein n=1 Tax=Terrilactibacillus laevilacticus TaxID=1380157 RepID=A0ABW5PNW6_9BACI|nr:DUF3021 domain-containing protein [Terrilactibacillus laevilacticus]